MQVFEKLCFFFAFFVFASLAGAVTVDGIPNKEILQLVMSQISDWSEVSDDAISEEFRLKKDKRLIKKVLTSYGYFDAEIKPSRKSGKVRFDVKLNERYKCDEVLLLYVDQPEYRSGLKIGQAFDLIGIEYDSYTDTKQLADGKDKIADFLKGKGFAFVYVAQPTLEKNARTKKMKATYRITLNGQTIIDKTIINIKSKKDPALLEPFIKNRIFWCDGDVYDLRKIEMSKNEIMKSGIFAGIDISLSEPVIDPKDHKISHTTITLNIEEALLRDIAAGIKYGSSEKLGVLFSWTHYNIDGKGSKFSVLADVAKKNRTLKVKYDVYDVFFRRQRLANQAFYSKEDVPSYDVSKVGAESMLWQSLGAKVNVGVGICGENAKTKDKIAENTVKFRAVGIPLGVNFDTTDDFLDPQKGARCLGVITPYLGNLTNMSIFSGRASVYFPIQKNAFKNAAVLAVYSKVGAIFNNRKNKTPRDKLLFSGGANSVRGYGYQKIGEVNDRKKPLGGERVFEIGVEPRFRVSDDFGLVTFLEGGRVHSRGTKHPWKKMLFGYGFGARYYTPFGVIRGDIAFPATRRKTTTGRRIDSPFNFYISIGQAF